MLKGFRDFILRGNVVELAVAVVIGAAFGAVVTSLVKDVITPLMGAVAGAPDFLALTLGPILIGNFINALLAFLTVAAAIYFLIVAPMNSDHDALQALDAGAAAYAPMSRVPE